VQPYDAGSVRRIVRVGVIGDRIARFVPQESIPDALGHAAESLGCEVAVDWFDTPALEHDAGGLLAACDAVWCAPGGPYRSLGGALEGIRLAREWRRPFIGTCAGFQHGVIETARNVAGIAGAAHAEYDDIAADADLFIDLLPCSLVGEEMSVEITDERTAAIYGRNHASERYYCRFGLDERVVGLLAEAGLVVAGIDATETTGNRSTRIMRRVDHPFFYLTLFVPQTSSAPGAPHPLVTALLAAALGQAHEP
jgi:CTP synthase (UTP-ammonia lyase)